MSDIRTEFLKYASRWIGSWYKWGGDDPSGFDCSGYVIEDLKAVGKFPRGEDTTANGLLSRFAIQKVADPRPGCLVFWLNGSGHAFHVEIVSMKLDGKWFSIGAKGGGSKTLTIEDAIRDNAFIKQREIKGSRIVYCDPFLGVL